MLIHNAFETFEKIKLHIDNKTPMSLIRIGDGEGAILGYPKYHNAKQIKRFYQIWFGDVELSHEQIIEIASHLKLAISSADIIGMPREKQYEIYQFFSCIPKVIEEENLIKSDVFYTHAQYIDCFISDYC